MPKKSPRGGSKSPPSRGRAAAAPVVVPDLSLAYISLLAEDGVDEPLVMPGGSQSGAYVIRVPLPAGSVIAK